MALLTALLVFAVPAILLSYSVDDSNFYDGLSDLSAFDASQSVNAALDSQGGLRLATDGTPTVSTWTSLGDFTGVGTGNGLYGQLTAAASGLTSASPDGMLSLQYMPLALDVDGTNPVFESVLATTTRTDSYEVQGPSVVKVAAGDYRMYYTGVAADGYRQRIFEATSTTGIQNSWAKIEGTGTGGCVLDLGGPGEFDEYGLVRPAVTYNASATPPFRMWYGALGKSSGTIGYAESEDGQHWVKHVDASGTPQPVVVPGRFGTADGYAVGEPSVTYDAMTKQYKMWYVGYPSEGVKGRGVGYATSSETTQNDHGAKWSKGGMVEVKGSDGNYSGGWFAPGAWTDATNGATPQWMIFAGKKGADQPYKLMTASSADGINWGYAGQLLDTGNPGMWDANNVFWASMLPDPLGGLYRIYYTGSGGSGDRTRNGIGYATSASGNNNATALGRIIAASSAGSRFDTNQSAQGTIWQDPNSGTLNMFYSGRSTLDLNWRIGVATSSVDPSSTTGGAAPWTRVDGTGDGVTKAVFVIGAPGSFDASGALSASIIAMDASSTSLAMLYEGVNAAGVSAIGSANTTSGALTSWVRNPTAVLTADASGFDATKVSHPSVIRTPDGLMMYYAGWDGADWEIGVATSTASVTSWNRLQSAVVTIGASGSIDVKGASDPVVAYDPSSEVPFRMWYTATADDDIPRVAYATSVDGYAWEKQGLAVIPSGDPWAFDEKGLRAASAWKNSSDNRWHVLYDGIDRGNYGNSAESPVLNWRRIAHASGTGEGYVVDGQGTYSLIPTGTPVPGYKYDFRDFSWDATMPGAASARLEVSFYPAYPGATDWSPYAPLDSDPKPMLPLFTEQVRWRVALGRGAGETSVTPTLDEMRVTWAPTDFCTTGTAISLPVGPSGGRYVESWTNLNITTDKVGGNYTAKVTVLDAEGRELIAAQDLANGVNTPIDLSGIEPGVTQIRVKFDLAGDGNETPYIKSWKVGYVSTNRAPVEGFQAFGTSTGTMVTWVNPEYDGYLSTRVLRSTVDFSTSPTPTVGQSVAWETSPTPGVAGQRESFEETSEAGQLVYYTAYTYDGTGWSPPARTLAVRRTPLTKLTAVAAGMGAKLAWTPVNASAITSPGTYAGITVAAREATLPMGPTGPGSRIVATDVKTGLATDASARPGINTYYAAYIHDVYRIGMAYYDCYSAPVTTMTVPLWEPVNGFDAMGYSTKAELSGRVPVSGPATYTLTIRRGGYTSVAISPTSGTSILTTTVAAGQEITRTVSSLTNLRSYWFTAFLTAKTSEGATLTSEPIFAVAVPRTARLSGMRATAGDRKVSLGWTRKTYVGTSTTYKYSYRGVRVIRGTGAYPRRVTDPTARLVVSGTTSLSSYTDTNVVNLNDYYYRGYAAVKATTKSGRIVTDYDYGYPSSAPVARPRYPVAVGVKPYSYSKYSSGYYYYPYSRGMLVTGTVTPDHAFFESTNATGYVTVYCDKWTYNSRTRRYYWKRVRTSTAYITRIGDLTEWRWAYKPSKGTYQFRAYFKGDSSHLSAYSSYKKVKIY